MSASLLQLIRPTFNLLGTDAASSAVGARLVTRDEAAKRPSSPRPESTMSAERPIEPMLAVYEARAETFRIVVAAVGRASSAIVEAARRGSRALRTRQPTGIALPE